LTAEILPIHDLETMQKEIPSLAKLEKKLQRKIQLFKYKNIHKVENKELANNIINGVTLNGFVEVIRRERSARLCRSDQKDLYT